MTLYKYKFIPVLIITLGAALLMPAIAPKMRLMYFTPLIVIAYYQRSLVNCITLSLCCGLMLDLLAADARFGIHAMNYSLTTLMLYPQRKHFFADKISTLPIMVFFFAVISSFIEIALQYVMQKSPNFTWQWIFCDLILMPAFDALYGFIVFTLPLFLFGKKQMLGKDYFTD